MKIAGGKIGGLDIRRRRVAAVVLGCFLLLILAASLLPEAGLRWGIAKGLRALGMVEVSVDDTDIALFGGRLTVRKVVARPALGEALGIGDFDLRFRWRPLLSRRLVLDRVALQGVEIELRREEDGSLVINGLPVAAVASPPESGGESSPPWGIDVASLELTRSRLKVMDGEVVVEVAVDRLTVENVNNLNPLLPISFALKGTLNGAAIEQSGTLRPFAAEPSFAVMTHAEGLNLADVGGLAARAGVRGLAGTGELSLAAEGRLTAAGPRVKGSGRLMLDGPALTAPVALKAGRLEVDVGRASWENGRADAAGQIAADGLSVKVEDGAGSAEHLSLAAKDLTWDNGRLSFAGRIDGKAVGGKAQGGEGKAEFLGVEAERLEWDGKALDWRGGLTVAGAHILAGGHDAASDRVEWAGRFQINAESAAGAAEGRLSLGPLALTVGDIRTRLKSAAAGGKVEFGKAVSAALDKASVEGLAVRDEKKHLDLAEVDRAELDAPRLSPKGAVAVRRVLAEGLRGLRRDGSKEVAFNWRAEARRLRLDQAERDEEDDVSLGEVRLEGLLARVNRTADGFTGLDFDDKDKKAKPEKAEDTPDIRIGRLVIADGRVNLRDRSLAETVRVDVVPLDLTVQDLNSEEPERDSKFEMKAGVGRGLVQAAGTLRPFADKISGKVDGTLTAFELPPLSPYLGEALGINLQSGHFDGTLGVGADQGKLAGKLDLTLSNLYIAAPDPNAPLAKKADMPIETVLDLLRDGEGRIRLSLPIRGDTANPDVDVSDAVAQAVAGALKSTVLTTLKLAFPVAALIELAMDESDSAHLALAPVGFAPGESALTGEHEKTLAVVAELLKGRPGLKLTLCGKADQAEWPAVAARRRNADRPLLSKLEKFVGYEREAADWGPPDRNSLSALAQRRTEAVRNHLVDQGGVETGRLFGCRPEVETAEGGKGPRVDLLL